MLLNEQEIRTSTLLNVVKMMATAARTAPKACGFDNLEIAIADRDDIERLASKMREIGGVNPKKAFFLRDADNIEKSEAILLVGTRNKVHGLDCGLCGYATCASKIASNKDTPCIFNTHDLGLAIGSAVSVAADCRVDNRVMYSVGVAAQELGMINNCCVVMSVPVACMGKNPFFDRKTISNCAK